MRYSHVPGLLCTWMALGLLASPILANALTDQDLEALRAVISSDDLARLTPEQQSNLSKLAANNGQQSKELTLCWTEGTDTATVEAFNRALARQFDDVIGAQLNQRWFETATNGDGLVQGDPTVITWSIFPDGFALPGFIGEPASNSNLVAWLSSLYGVVTNNNDYTDENWFHLFEQSFDRWAQATGLTYVYEPVDDGATFGDAAGSLGMRGDVRIGGHLIDGNNGILAYNFFPDTGDMVIDTADGFFNDTAANSLGLRTVVMHESGHGIGLRHVESNDAQFLMEPFINLGLGGPQFDDILGANRHYGDYEEWSSFANNTAGGATSLGAIEVGNTATRALLSADNNSDVDYYAFTVEANTIAVASVVPQGFTYNQGVLGSAMTSYSPQAFGDLLLEILDTDGINVLGTADNTGVGGSESLQIPLPGAGTYFVRVRSSLDQAQMYDLSVMVDESCDDCVTAVCDADVIVGNGFGAGSNFQRRVCFTNCGATTTDFNYRVNDTQGWCAESSGAATLAPGETLCVTVNCAVPGSTPGGTTSTLTLIASSVNCSTVADTCSSLITVDDTVPVAIHGMQVLAGERGVEMQWNVGDNWHIDLLGVQVQRAENIEGPYVNIGNKLQPYATMSYKDDSVQPDHRYWYRLISIAVDGNITTPPVEVTTSSFTLVSQLHAPSVSDSRAVQIRYDLGHDSSMRLEIYDARGRRVRSLEVGNRRRGTYVVEWNGRNDAGATAARGVYFISLSADRQKFSRKVVLAR